MFFLLMRVEYFFIDIFFFDLSTPLGSVPPRTPLAAPSGSGRPGRAVGPTKPMRTATTLLPPASRVESKRSEVPASDLQLQSRQWLGVLGEPLGRSRPMAGIEWFLGLTHLDGSSDDAFFFLKAFSV